jgi:hypothetical protein
MASFNDINDLGMAVKPGEYDVNSDNHGPTTPSTTPVCKF